MYLNLGRGEMRAEHGRPAGGLPARCTRGVAAAGRRGRAGRPPPHTLYALAEAIFAYIDELSADSIEGYAREQAAAAGRSSAAPAPGRAADPGAAGHTGRHRGRGGERRLAAAAQPGRARRRGGRGAASRPTGSLCVWDPRCSWSRSPRSSWPWCRRAAGAGSFELAVRGRRAALGPPSVAGGRRELRACAARAATPGRRRRNRGRRRVAARRAHKLSLLLGVDRRLARVGRSRRPRRRSRARPSCRASGSARRSTPGCGTAAAPRRCRQGAARASQTVRYRLARLRELFGPRLDDPTPASSWSWRCARATSRVASPRMAGRWKAEWRR